MSNTVTGEICDGIAYIDWAGLHALRPGSEGPLMQCIGRHRRFEVKNFTSPDIFGPTERQQVSSKYIRSFGSTAILLSPPDDYGRQTARAQTLGPWENRGVEVGPIETKFVELLKRTRSEGIEKTMLEPAQLLGQRSWMVASRSADMFRAAVVPVRDFLVKMRNRVPELVEETYHLATSIKIEIKFDDDFDDSDDKPQP
jgi:hypothetical protein